MAISTRGTTPILWNFCECTCRPGMSPLVSLTDRQERLSWWHQPTMSASSIGLIGAGGLGSAMGLMLVQQGIGRLEIVDFDRVEQTNRSRQLYTRRDVGKYKALALPHRIKPFATYHTVIRGHAAAFQTITSALEVDLILCGVDNDATNIAVARHARDHRIPAVFVNVSADGESCRIFLQHPGGACFACYKPSALSTQMVQPCTPTPAIVDILHVAAGVAVRAGTTILMGQQIGPYNCRDLTMDGINIIKTVTRTTTCPICK